jgi:hypothetical protein
VIFKYKGHEVARHIKSHEKNQFFLDIFHYKETLKRKPGALNSSLCLKQSSKLLQDVYNNFFKADPKEFIRMLEDFTEYSIFQIKQACKTLGDSGVKVKCDAIRMVLMSDTGHITEAENEPDEIERACLRELRLFAEGRCSA